MKAFAIAVIWSMAAALAGANGSKALRYLETATDRYHRTLDVYTDHGAAGNHFAVRARMSSYDDLGMHDAAARVVPAMDEGWTVRPHSGATCIRASLKAELHRGLPNWGAWYFMNGVLRDGRPQPNWGEQPNAGLNLSGAKKLTLWARGEKGGERVQFIAFGIGWHPNRKARHPDSSPKAIKEVELSKEWEQHEIELAGRDLSYVLGGFGWSADAGTNGMRDIVFYIDDVQYELDRRDEPRFVVSFETAQNDEFDRVNRNSAHTYDNALVLLAFLAAGDTRRAKAIADAFVASQSHDRSRGLAELYRGSLRNAYQGGDLFTPPGWGGRSARLPRWYDKGEWREDSYSVSLDTGNMAWAMLALIAYHQIAANPTESLYLDAAKKIGDWVHSHCASSVGYTGGYTGWEPSPEKAAYRSTEHNIDLYAAFTRLHQITGEGKWQERADRACAFVMAMWDETNGVFWTGMQKDTINTKVVPLDVQAWVVLSLRDAVPRDWGERALGYVETHMRVDGGYDYSRRACSSGATACEPPQGVWYEGTAQMALAYQELGEPRKARAIVSAIAAAQELTGAVNASNRADGLPTGFIRDNMVLAYFKRPHIGATAWYVFAARGANPYWLGAAR